MNHAFTVTSPPPRGSEVPLLVTDRIPRVRASPEGQDLELRLDTGATLAPGPRFHVNVTSAQSERLGLPERGTGARPSSSP